MRHFSKLAALGSCSLIGLSAFTPAMAQDTKPVQAQEAKEDGKAGDTTVDTLVVSSFREGLAKSRDIMRASENLVEVQAADDVGKLPDTNIDEALRRLTSVYLIRDQGEGRYVSIRGADPILNNVTMNGQTIAVSDTDGESGRAAPLDVLSASALNRVEIHKVTLPNMDGQSIGGTINIVTPSGYDHNGRYINASAETGYNDFGKDSKIWSTNFSASDRFGANDEFAVFVSGEYWFKQYTSQQYTSSGSQTAPGYPAHYYFPTSVVYAESIGEKERYGASINLEYRPDDATRAWARYFFTQYNDDRTRPQITIKGLQGRAVAAPAVRRPILNPVSQTEFGFAGYRSQMETRAEVQQRPVQQFVVGGEHSFGKGWKLVGDLNYTTAKELNPYQRYFEAITDTPGALPTEAPAITFVQNGEGLAQPKAYNTALTNGLTFTDPAFNTVYRLRGVTSTVIEKTYTGNTDLSWDGDLADHQFKFQTGAKVILRTKSVDDTDYRYQFTGPKTTLAAFNGLSMRFDDGRGEAYQPVSSLSLIAPDRYRYEAYFQANPGNFTYDAVGAASNSIENDYHLQEDIYAGYVMGELHLTPALSVTAGARVERTNSDISAQGFVAQVSADPNTPVGRSRLGEVPFKTSDIIDISRTHNYTNFLPAAVLRWDLGKQWLLRASVTTNIGRPDYTDIAPISTIVVSEFYDRTNDKVELDASVEIGNPDLKPYKALNFDASLDYYFADNSGSLTFGVFNKRVRNAVYSIDNEYKNYSFEGVTYDNYIESTVTNAGPGYIRGIELSAQKDFKELPAPFDGLGVYANASFIDSEVEINVPGRPDSHVPFFNQADKIFNLQAYYEHGGFEGRVAYSYQGKATSSSFGANPDIDIYRDPRKSVDARVAYRFGNGVQLALSGQNLGNPAFISRRKQEGFNISSYEVFGREFRLSISKTW